MPVTRCTEEQARTWLAQWAQAGFSSEKAAKMFGVCARHWRQRIKLAKKQCPDSGLIPTDVPDGMRFTKTTVQYDAQGNVVNEWRRLSKTAEDLQKLSESIGEALRQKCPKLPRPSVAVMDKRTLVVPFYDSHFGKYAWEAETGEDYDSDIAEKMMVGTSAIAAQRSGRVGEVVLIIGGDFSHADGRVPQTERSGHVLDVDSRVERVRDIMIRALVKSISLFSSIADKVHVVFIPGNHDFETMHWLARCMELAYKDQKHVTVDRSPKSRRYLERGTMLLGIDHGMLKINEYLTLMPCEAREAWARTTERLWLLGHIHQQKVIQKHGVTVEHLESISATDAWHAENGYVGNPRRTVTFLIDHDYGLVSRNYITVKEASR